MSFTNHDAPLSVEKLSLFKSKYRFQLPVSYEKIIRNSRNNLLTYLDDVVYRKAAKYIDIGGLRGEIPLTQLQKNEIAEYAKSYGISEADIIFSSEFGMNTAFKRVFGQDRLYINTDVMPAVNGTRANSKLSWRAAIAHEFEGHRVAELAGKSQVDPLLEEIQASMRASIHGKELSTADRELLKLDAIERFDGTGILFDDIKNSL